MMMMMMMMMTMVVVVVVVTVVLVRIPALKGLEAERRSAWLIFCNEYCASRTAYGDSFGRKKCSNRPANAPLEPWQIADAWLGLISLPLIAQPRKVKKGGYNTEIFKEAGKVWASSEERPNYEALAAAEKEKIQAERELCIVMIHHSDVKPQGSHGRVQEVCRLLGPDTGSGQVPSGESGPGGSGEG